MGYGNVSRAFHWITVAIVLVMISAGLIMTQDGVPRSVKDPIYMLHKGLGAVFLAFILLRIIWRAFNPPPPLPSHMPAAQVWAARLTHLGLYVFLLVMATTGYVRVIGEGFPIELFNWLGIPPLIPRMDETAKAAGAVHGAAKWGLMALIALHVAAATYHGIVRRDGVFSRMWPPFSRGKTAG